MVTKTDMTVNGMTGGRTRKTTVEEEGEVVDTVRHGTSVEVARTMATETDSKIVILDGEEEVAGNIIMIFSFCSFYLVVYALRHVESIICHLRNTSFM